MQAFEFGAHGLIRNGFGLKRGPYRPVAVGFGNLREGLLKIVEAQQHPLAFRAQAFHVVEHSESGFFRHHGFFGGERLKIVRQGFVGQAGVYLNDSGTTSRTLTLRP